MIASRARAWLLALALAPGLVLPAAAQVGKPKRLFPAAPAPAAATPSEAEKPLAEPAPAPVTEPSGTTETAETPNKPPTAAAQDSVSVGELAEIDPSSVGILNTENGGFGGDMWAGSDRLLVERLLPRLPMATPSRAMQSLAQRLLASQAMVPEGETEAPSLLGIRVERLSAGGRTTMVNDLLELVSARLIDPAFSRAKIDGLLLAGNNAEACADVPELIRQYENPYWLKTMTFCKALCGEHEAAQLAASILREQGETGDVAFFNLVAVLGGDNDTVVDSLIDPSPLHIAMLRAARRAVPGDAVPGARPAILRAIATTPNAAIETRLQAAERAEAAGALPADALAQVYASVDFTPEEREDWVVVTAQQEGPRSNALLYQVAASESDPDVRARALAQAWKQARGSGRFGTAARVNLEAARQLEPTPELAWVAAAAGRALLAAGDVDAARRWLDSVTAATTESNPNPHAVRAVLELWPLVQIADDNEGIPWNAAIATPWWEGQKGLSGDKAQENAALLYTLFDALGYRLPDANWKPLYEAPLTVSAYMPSTALWHGLERASSEGRVGETVLLSLLALGEVGPLGANPVTLHGVMRALRRIGLTAPARRIALEAALARGL
ncbi:MAG: hypothetical protein QGH01_00870 [Alphaproteobacteria bacterium]|nr:hypothetical protein [Alphaproteobacteria bacterium]